MSAAHAPYSRAPALWPTHGDIASRYARAYFASSYKYSTNDIVAPSYPCSFGFVDSIT